MKTKLALSFNIIIALFVVLGCKQSEETSSGPSISNPYNPVPTKTRFYLVDTNGKVVAEQIKTVFDGRLYKFTNGPFFILSGRLDYDNAFSSQMPMENAAGQFGVNCKFASPDCSGPCLIDANHGKPLKNSLLIANEQEHLFGKADRVYHYTDQEVKTDVVQTLSRLELYGYGPYCQSIDSILDNYYSLDDISSTMPDLHNNDLRVISEEAN